MHWDKMARGGTTFLFEWFSSSTPEPIRVLFRMDISALEQKGGRLGAPARLHGTKCPTMGRFAPRLCRAYYPSASINMGGFSPWGRKHNGDLEVIGRDEH